MKYSALKRNSIWNIVEVVSATLVLFLLYKIILKSVGVSALGIWSLVLATTSLARVADLGAAGGLGRYVAISNDGNGTEDVLIYVETALITNALLYLAIGGALYWPAWLALGWTLHGQNLSSARALLPYAIGSFVLQNISFVTTAALVGFHKSYQKSILVLCSLVIQITIALLSIRHIGLSGVALAQIAQFAFIVTAGWLLVLRAVGARKLSLPRRVGRKQLNELMGFGLRLQTLNIAAFLFDPLTKFTLSSLGGLTVLGTYELASRGILQVRQLVAAPAQNLTPLFAAANARNPEDLGPLYNDSFVAMAMASSCTMLGMAVGSPIISLVWLHRIDSNFVVYSSLISCGWLVSMISAPGYFLGIGTGRLKWNIWGSVVTTLGSPSLAYVFHLLFGSAGIVAGAMLAVAGGAGITWLMNCRSLGLSCFPERAAWGRAIGKFATSAKHVFRRIPTR